MTNPSTASGCVVLVEDEDAVREVLTVLLESAGWKVLSAPDGPSGLALVAGARPQVVVTDLRLPGMSGIQLATRVAAESTLQCVPVVAITSDESDLRDAAVRCGRFVTVLTKPLAPAVLLEAVAGAIHGRA